MKIYGRKLLEPGQLSIIKEHAGRMDSKELSLIVINDKQETHNRYSGFFKEGPLFAKYNPWQNKNQQNIIIDVEITKQAYKKCYGWPEPMIQSSGQATVFFHEFKHYQQTYEGRLDIEKYNREFNYRKEIEREAQESEVRLHNYYFEEKIKLGQIQESNPAYRTVLPVEPTWELL